MQKERICCGPEDEGRVSAPAVAPDDAFRMLHMGEGPARDLPPQKSFYCLTFCILLKYCLLEELPGAGHLRCV